MARRKGAKDWKPGQPAGTPRDVKELVEWLDQEGMYDVAQVAWNLHSTDSPSPSDVRGLFAQYAAGDSRFREGVDAAFRWWTGYNLDSILAQWVAGKDWEDLIDKWRKK